eukprot:TRINITY_DN11329_c0_g1_i9.p1 TRINITY_DN11329_c0_g1~~TRINITY_DN11329_c0_g1_i9.p1  ORF type:complete len:227 (+),score=31.16 TRINITY_DN11329_c0_g1_i9:71-751(+)
MWEDYFVFTTVRNPYSRATSGYSYLLKRREKLNTNNTFGCQNPSFKSYSQNPFMIGVQSQQFSCADSFSHDYLHVEEETQCLLTANGESAVDYIFSMENFVEDWSGMVTALVNRHNKKTKQAKIQRQQLLQKQEQNNKKLQFADQNRGQSDNFYSNYKSSQDQQQQQYLEQLEQYDSDGMATFYINKLQSVVPKHVNSVAGSKEYAKGLYAQCGLECMKNIANFGR